MELPKHYNPGQSEPKWTKYWEEQNIYAFDPEDTKKEIFSIDTPPPTVSGKMHMGHAFGNSQQDFIARFKRMQGFNVLQPFGTDDNGLPTKLLIEKTKKVSASKMDRKEFVALVLKTLKEELRPKYTQDWKRLGISCDFNVSYTTINEHCQRISQKSFLDLYKEGRQYRVEAPAMYCPKCQTAISQVELEDLEEASTFNTIVFDADGEKLHIATTRPELLPACVSIFYHPDDKRYQHLEGKTASSPLFNVDVPIMADKGADPEKGTGLVMCCTFGDQKDTEWQRAHQLPMKVAINKYGKMTDLAGKYEKLKVKDARAEIIEDLKAAELLIEQKPITHTVNVHERCGTPIEFVHSKQWFIKILDKKEDMLKWGEELNWYPEHMKNRYDNWAKGLSWDWLISRQLPFGIPFPVWYCDDCDEIIVANEESLPVDPTVDKAPVDTCPKCKSHNIIPEKDIINTWATSSLTPTIVKELFKGKPVYEKLKNNPMSFRPQGHDIISFWLFNTVVKSQLHYGMKPWNDCFINGWMLDPKGKKMSKSKGNIIEPQGMIEKYSADALRFMAGGSKVGEDLPFQEKDLLAGKKTATKIWNASKFVIMQLEGYTPTEKPANLRTIDKWLLSKLSRLVASSTEFFEDYQYARAKLDTDTFFWQNVCEMYLEIVKDRTYNPEGWADGEKEAGQYTLYTAQNTLLKLFAPFMPFITEEVYQLYFKQYDGAESIHTSAWPVHNVEDINEESEQIGDVLINIVQAVRKEKSTAQLSMKASVKKLYVSSDLTEVQFQEIKQEIEKSLFVESIVYATGAFDVKVEFNESE